MFSLSDISVEFLTGLPVLVILAGLVLLAGAVIIYYRTNPPVSAYVRVILWILRAIALSLLLLALLEPIIRYARETERKPRIALLEDYSASMDHGDNGASRVDRIDSLLSSDSFRSARGKVELSRFFFADGLSDNSSTLARDKTALGDAIAQLDAQQLEEPADYWMLFSDGNSNSGRDAVRAAAGGTPPIVVVDVATGTGDFDLRLSNIEHPGVLFAGRRTDINVRLQWHNAEGRSAIVELREGGRVLHQEQMEIGSDGDFGDLELDYLPNNPGQHLLDIAIVPLEGERNTDNNRRTISVDVLKSRLQVLLVAERPDYETGFLNRHLRGADRYDIDLVVTGAKAGNLGKRLPSSQTELNRYDVVILDDPTTVSLQPLQSLLRSYLADRGGALWLLMGSGFAQIAHPDWLVDLLPFFPSGRTRAQYVSFQAEPSESDLFHPALRLGDDRAAIRERWANLPPFAVIVPCDSLDANASILATARIPSQLDRAPVLGQKRLGPGKVMACAAGPFWRWGFVSLGLGEDPGSYARFVDGVLSWLTVSDDFAPVRVVPEKKIFTRGETIRFDGFAFDLGFRPIPGASGSVLLVDSAAGERYESDLLQTGEGRYQARFGRIPPGTYAWEGYLSKDGRELRRQEGQIRVESFTLEDFDQSGDPQTLRAVANRSGGSYVSYSEFDRAVAALPTGIVYETITGEITLFHRSWMLITIIAALCLEWLIRKINHLL